MASDRNNFSIDHNNNPLNKYTLSIDVFNPSETENLGIKIDFHFKCKAPGYANF